MTFYFQIEQLQSLAEESQMLKDEMDVLRHSQEKVVSYYFVLFLHIVHHKGSAKAETLKSNQ